MTRATNRYPERGDARTRLLAAARDIIRTKGYGGTSIDDLCQAAGVTKGAFFHHFPSKEALGVSAADDWSATTGAFFAAAPYHQHPDPLDRLLAYVAFRRSIISEDFTEFTCLVGTMAQELHQTAPAIRDACGASMLGHAATLEADIEAAMQQHGVRGDAASLARHTQVVIQGAFVLAKGGNDPKLAREALDHLATYIRLIFNVPRESGNDAN